MRRLTVIFLSLICAFASMAQVENTEEKGKRPLALRYRVSGATGYILRGSIIEPWIGTRPVLGGEVAVEFMPTGRIESLQWYNNASIGLAFSALDLTNTEILGQAFTPYAYLNIPFVRLPHFVFGIRPGIGLAFVTKTYYNTTDIADRYTALHHADGTPIGNGGSGSHTNAFFTGALYMEFPVKSGFSICATGGWYHISNGSIRQPNSGFNMLNAQLGLVYQPNEAEYDAPDSRVPHRLYEGKRWDVELAVSGGARQAYYLDNKNGQRFFGVAALGVSAHYRPWSIFKIGGGIDVFYDGWYRSVCDEFENPTNAPVTYFGKTYLSESNIANCFRVGVSVQPEFVLGKFSAGFHLGFYLYDNIKDLEPYADAEQAGGKMHRGVFYAYDILNAGDAGHADGWLYTHVVLKYRVTKHWFLQFGAKSHMAKVEFFDFGTGVAF